MASHVAPNEEIAPALIDWFLRNAREFPWRVPNPDPWGILVSEFMAQQTQIERVVPKWIEWMERWPKPSALAADAPGEAVRAWDRLGYPRRALWLHRAAVTIASEHNDEVPRDIDTLLSLPGVGPYTARAVAVFAFGERHPVVDTNTRRVIARARRGVAQAGYPRAKDLADLLEILPTDLEDQAVFNAGIMELGAIVCTARQPACGACPIAGSCAWRAAGYPDNAPPKRPVQARFTGSDREARGRIMALARGRARVPVDDALAAAGHTGRTELDPDQPLRALESLLGDGLLVRDGDSLRLP